MPDVGRPTVMTPEVLHKLEEAFAIGCSDTEACSYADISPRTLYKYQEDEPEFIQRKEQLKEKPILKAKNTIVKALSEPEHAKWYLERKRKNEFAQRSEHTGADGKDLPVPILGNIMVNKDAIPNNNGNPQNSESDKENQSSTGGDIGE